MILGPSLLVFNPVALIDPPVNSVQFETNSFLPDRVRQNC